jgi:hypothetical protein
MKTFIAATLAAFAAAKCDNLQQEELFCQLVGKQSGYQNKFTQYNLYKSCMQSKDCMYHAFETSAFAVSTLNLAETYVWAPLPQSNYVDNSLKCAAFKTKMTDAQSAGNKTKYAYYYTSWTDTCQIKSYRG